jgi:hypothetical protein
MCRRVFLGERHCTAHAHAHRRVDAGGIGAIHGAAKGRGAGALRVSRLPSSNLLSPVEQLAQPLNNPNRSTSGLHGVSD